MVWYLPIAQATGLLTQDWEDGSTHLHGPLLTLTAGSVGTVVVHNELTKPVDESFAVRPTIACREAGRASWAIIGMASCYFWHVMWLLFAWVPWDTGLHAYKAALGACILTVLVWCMTGLRRRECVSPAHTLQPPSSWQGHMLSAHVHNLSPRMLPQAKQPYNTQACGHIAESLPFQQT